MSVTNAHFLFFIGAKTMTDYINIPEPGSTWLYDCSINAPEWMRAVLGEPVHYSDSDWDCDDNVIEEIMEILEAQAEEEEWDEVPEMEFVARDNVYNNENDFDNVFTWSIVAPKGTHEWYYGNDYRNLIFVVVCQHHGGDPRNSNYSRPMIYRPDGDLAEGGFLDWVIGWYVVDSLHLNPVAEADEFRQGYHSNPTCHLEDALEGEGEWRDDGGYHARMADGRYVICYPDLYVNC
tara:strand:+ start:407 stop:1111 length:705 start_codon:yes stop_codon:yes gene_type:complete